MNSQTRPEVHRLGPRLRAMVLVIGVLALGWSAACVVTRYIPNDAKPDWYPDIPFQKGMDYTSWDLFSYNSSQAREDFQEMRAAGVEWVAINDQSYQSNLTSDDIHPSSNDDSLTNLSDAFAYARSLGLHILFKPMLGVESGEWCSYIVYTPAWMAAYSAWIVSQAKIAAQCGADILSIGCELGNMQGHSNAVRSMIAAVRSVYHGQLTYAANYDGFWTIDWYDAIDVIGVDMYPPMLFTYTPSLTDLIQFWNGLYTRLEDLSARWNCPILFTEIGAQAEQGSNLSPSNNRFDTQQDVGWLVDMYKSVFQSKLWTAPWFKGVYWWVWDNYEPDPAHPELDTQFSPEIPAVLATITTEYSSTRQPVPSDFLANSIVPIVAGGAVLVLLAWKLDRNGSGGHRSRRHNRSTGEMALASNDPDPPAMGKPGLAIAMLQGSLLGTTIYLWYANITLPLFFTGYYNTPTLPLYAIIISVAIIIVGACMHVAARQLPDLMLVIMFLYACWYSGTISGLSFDWSWLKVFLDALMAGFSLAALARVTSINNVPGRACLKMQLVMALVTLGCFFACAVIFDQAVAGFAVVPAGLGLLATRVPHRGKTSEQASNSKLVSSITTDFSAELAQDQFISIPGTLFVTLVAAVLLPLGSSDYNLLYMNLLPLVLSLLSPVLAGIAVVMLVLCLRAWLVKKHDATNRLLRSIENRTRVMLSSKGMLIFALMFEGGGIGLIITGAPHVLWSILAGILLIFIIWGILLRASSQKWREKNGHVFLYLVLIGVMTTAGTILDAIKGSIVYSLTSQVSFNVVIAINTIVTAACIPVTVIGLVIEWLVQRRRGGNHHNASD